MIPILFIGESWLGSCARSLKEAIGRRSDITLDDLSENAWFTTPRARWLRALNRLTRPAYLHEFNEQVLSRVRITKPQVVMTYKGHPVEEPLLRQLRAAGPLTVNVYPDCSPHAHGHAHRKAVGVYDFVISTKAYHPAAWRTLYGYSNDCAFVPQGYDPMLHLVAEPPTSFEFDVAVVSTYRPEYGRLMAELGRSLSDPKIRVAIGGDGWGSCHETLPAHWTIAGPLHGRSYVRFLRKAKICIAPLTREMVVNGERQLGDVDTTRTYELAAAHCFFIHRRTDFARTLYDESEVPMFNDAAELARHIEFYLPRDTERAHMAASAHRRAVPAYSLDARAAQIVKLVREALERRGLLD